MTRQSQTSLRRATPPLSFSQQAAVGLSDPLSDLPSTPSTHRTPSEPGEAEDRIDQILGRKRRASTLKADGEGAQSGKRAKKVVKGSAGRGGRQGKRRSMRIRAHDAEPESEDDKEQEEEEEEDVVRLNSRLLPFNGNRLDADCLTRSICQMVDNPSPSPQPDVELSNALSPGHQSDDDQADPDATIRSRTPIADSAAVVQNSSAAAPISDKSRSPSLASDDFYS